MRVYSFNRRGSLFLILFYVVSLCNADEQTFEVVGTGECADCKEDSLPFSAYLGLHVTIDCKLNTGKIKRVGAGELDESGKFKIQLPQGLIQDGKNLKEECYAQLHNGLQAAKIVFKSQINGKTVFSPTKTLRFSSALFTSKFLCSYFQYPPLPKTHPWKKNWPKLSFPPFCMPKPLYPPTPTYEPEPKPPVIKPLPPTAPTYKPKPPKKPLPPPAPTYKPKPKPPVMKPLPPPAPAYKSPGVTKPLPPPFPLYPIPPFYKKPCPPFPKIPPKYFHHPKFGYFPPLPPFFPQP